MRIDVKRFYLPGFVIKAICPHCGQPAEMDLSGEYLSYPSTGEQEVRMYCDHEDEHDFTVRVRLSVNLEAVEGCTVGAP